MRLLLTKVQKNEIYEMLTKIGLNPAEFEFFVNNKNETTLKHLPTEYYCKFSSTYNCVYWLELAPGNEMHTQHFCLDGWSYVLPKLGSWLYQLKREIDTPDLWQSYIRIDTKLSFDEKENSPFTVAEYKLLVDKLSILEVKMTKQFKLSAQQLSELKLSFDQLKGKAESLGKRDWFMYFMGCLQNIVVALAFQPDQVQNLVNLVRETFSNAVRLISS